MIVRSIVQEELKQKKKTARELKYPHLHTFHPSMRFFALSLKAVALYIFFLGTNVKAFDILRVCVCVCVCEELVDK